MEFTASPPAAIATAIAEELDRSVDYLSVTGEGAARAAELIAELI
jgi:hypothetical protein